MSMSKLFRITALPTILILSLLVSACGAFSFANQLKLVLSVSDPLISSLPISAEFKSGLVVDFKDLANGAATMAQEFQAIAKDDPQSRSKHLLAVERFANVFDTVEARGHFGAHERIVVIRGILRGIITSARLYYAPTVGLGANSKEALERDLDAKLKQLKREMEPGK